LALWPLVVLLYRRVARMEEADLVAAHGLEAERYIAAVPGFLPRLSRGATRQDVTTVVKPLGKESTRR
jgi:hypothetical protein